MVPSVLAGRYHILERVGEGGVAEVFKAMDTRLERVVALKVLRESYSQDPTFTQRFENEAKVAARLSHSAMVDVYDYDYVDGRYIIAMEYVPGRTLKEYVTAEGPLSEAESKRLASQILEGLAVAHEAGLVHRDMKPQNVLMAPSGRLKIADFGIAKVLGDQGMTQGVLPFGSPHYLSPEQAFGEEVSPRTDLYAIGVMLYEMLAGRLPFEGGSALKVAYSHLFEQPTPLREVAPDVSPEMAALVERAMAKDPQGRFPSARAMLAALNEVPVREEALPPEMRLPAPVVAPRARAGGQNQDGTAVAGQPRTAPALSRPTRRRRFSPLWGAIPLLALVGVGLWALLGSDGARDRERNLAAASLPDATATARAGASARVAPRPGGTDSARAGGAPPATSAPLRTATPGPTSAPTETPRVIRYVASATFEGVNLRAEPGQGAQVVAAVPHGSMVQVATSATRDGLGREWFEVTYGSRTGYVLGDMLSITRPASRPPKTREPAATLVPTAEPAEAPAAVATPVTALEDGSLRVRFSTESFGGGFASPDGMYKGRPARFLYPSSTDYSRVVARFTIEGRPRGDRNGNAGFGLVGLDSSGRGKARIRVEVNGRPVYEGPSGVPDDDPTTNEAPWGDLARRFPASHLKSGENVLTITNLDAQGTLGRGPWIALHNAVVVYYPG